MFVILNTKCSARKPLNLLRRPEEAHRPLFSSSCCLSFNIRHNILNIAHFYTFCSKCDVTPARPFFLKTTEFLLQNILYLYLVLGLGGHGISKCIFNFPLLDHPPLAKSLIGPSEVRALPVRRCRRAAWQT
jgi:hypothetical protein